MVGRDDDLVHLICLEEASSVSVCFDAYVVHGIADTCMHTWLVSCHTPEETEELTV